LCPVICAPSAGAYTAFDKSEFSLARRSAARVIEGGAFRWGLLAAPPAQGALRKAQWLKIGCECSMQEQGCKNRLPDGGVVQY
jgi:hypothetical protein